MHPVRRVTIALLTPAVLLVHGYHPLADDGAVYVTGIKKLANPEPLSIGRGLRLIAHPSLDLCPRSCPAASLGTSLPALAAGLPPGFDLSLSSRLVASGEPNLLHAPRCWGAVLLAACCFTLPVAGTSLSIMDPYVTARSFSTPLSLFALAAVLDEKWAASILWLALAALLHPLMAGYAAIAMLTLALARRRMWRSLGLFCRAGMAAVRSHLHALTRHCGPQPLLQPRGPQPFLFFPLQLAMV